MAQVINPSLPKDDSLNQVLAGLQIYSSIRGIGKEADETEKKSMATANDYMDAMKRRLDSMNQGGGNGSG